MRRILYLALLFGGTLRADTVLVLSGVSTRETINEFPYTPKYILEGVGEIAG